MPTDFTEISFETLFQNIKRNIIVLKKEADYYREVVPENYLKKLQKAVEDIGGDTSPEAPPTFEIYIKQWKEFVSGKRTYLDKRAIRHLCYEPTIALDEKFIRYIEKSNTTIGVQHIRALVRSCHMKWNKDLIESSVSAKIRGYVKSYSGHHQLIKKWKENLKIILGETGTELFAKKMLDLSTSPDVIFKEWGVDNQSAFASDTVVTASGICKANLGRTNSYNEFLLNGILPWDKWDSYRETFKKEIESIILNNSVETIREQFQPFILRNKLLGNPLVSNAVLGWRRIPENPNWQGISEEAKRKVIGWLTRENIEFFFDHVLPDGHDPHRRKDFWLQYVNRFIARPLLSLEDERRLQRHITLNKDKIAHRGRIWGGVNSAFILDFEDIVVVEFSKSGKCYVFTDDEFKRVYPNIWTTEEFLESKLKNQSLPDERKIRHNRIDQIVNYDWREKIYIILARYGIRRG